MDRFQENALLFRASRWSDDELDRRIKESPSGFDRAVLFDVKRGRAANYPIVDPYANASFVPEKKRVALAKLDEGKAAQLRAFALRLTPGELLKNIEEVVVRGDELAVKVFSEVLEERQNAQVVDVDAGERNRRPEFKRRAEEKKQVGQESWKGSLQREDAPRIAQDRAIREQMTREEEEEERVNAIHRVIADLKEEFMVKIRRICEGMIENMDNLLKDLRINIEANPGAIEEEIRIVRGLMKSHLEEQAKQNASFAGSKHKKKHSKRHGLGDDE